MNDLGKIIIPAVFSALIVSPLAFSWLPNEDRMSETTSQAAKGVVREAYNVKSLVKDGREAPHS